MNVNGIGINNLVDVERLIKGNKVESSINAPYYYVSEPVEAIIVNVDNLRPFRKAPYVTKFMNIEDIKLLEVMNNRYIPIYESGTNNLVFSLDEFNSYRKRMSGLEEYGTGDYQFSENLYFPGLDKFLNQIDSNINQVDYYRDNVYKEIIDKLSKHGYRVTIGSNSGGDIELVEAGSTSRYTNIPSSDDSKKWDFDFTVRFRLELTSDVKKILENELMAGDHITRTSTYKVRLVDVLIPGLDKKVDLDFSLTPQLENYLSTEDAISQRLDNMKKQDLNKYRLVLANIMYAKSLLKSSGCYKPSRGILDGDRQNGGLGGVGIENWILQNGGSFIDASREFFSHADGKEFDEFEQEYAIMDFGANHVGKSKRVWPYDNFIINNMRHLGYEKMRDCLKVFLEELEMEQRDENDKVNDGNERLKM